MFHLGKYKSLLFEFHEQITARKLDPRYPLPHQYFDLIAYVSPIVNWNEFRLVGGNDTGGSFR